MSMVMEKVVVPALFLTFNWREITFMMVKMTFKMVRSMVMVMVRSMVMEMVVVPALFLTFNWSGGQS